MARTPVSEEVGVNRAQNGAVGEAPVIDRGHAQRLADPVHVPGGVGAVDVGDECGVGVLARGEDALIEGGGGQGAARGDDGSGSTLASHAAGDGPHDSRSLAPVPRSSKLTRSKSRAMTGGTRVVRTGRICTPLSPGPPGLQQQHAATGRRVGGRLLDHRQRDGRTRRLVVVDGHLDRATAVTGGVRRDRATTRWAGGSAPRQGRRRPPARRSGARESPVAATARSPGRQTRHAAPCPWAAPIDHEPAAPGSRRVRRAPRAQAGSVGVGQLASVARIGQPALARSAPFRPRPGLEAIMVQREPRAGRCPGHVVELCLLHFRPRTVTFTLTWARPSTSTLLPRAGRRASSSPASARTPRRFPGARHDDLAQRGRQRRITQGVKGYGPASPSSSPPGSPRPRRGRPPRCEAGDGQPQLLAGGVVQVGLQHGHGLPRPDVGPRCPVRRRERAPGRPPGVQFGQVGELGGSTGARSRSSSAPPGAASVTRTSESAQRARASAAPVGVVAELDCRVSRP